MKALGTQRKVTPKQWQSLLPQTFPADAPGHDGDQALLLQTSTDQLGQLTPPRQVSPLLAMGSPAWDMQGWDQQRWEDRVSFCSIACAGGEEAMGPWGAGKPPRLGCSCALGRCLSAIIFRSRKRKEVQGRLQADPDTCLGPASFLHMLAKMVPVPALKRQKMFLLAVIPQLLQAITEGHEWALGPCSWWGGGEDRKSVV